MFQKKEQCAVSTRIVRLIASALLFVAGLVSFASFFVTWYTAEVGKNRLLMSPIRRIESEPFNAGTLVWRLAVMISAITGVVAGILALGICAGTLDPNITFCSVKTCLSSASVAILMVLMTSGVIDSGTFEVGFFLCIGVILLASVALSLLCWDTWNLQDSGYKPVPQDPNSCWDKTDPAVEMYVAPLHEPYMQDQPRFSAFPVCRSPFQEEPRPPSPPRPPALDLRQAHPTLLSTGPPLSNFSDYPGIQFIQGPPPNALSTPKLRSLPPVILQRPPTLPTLTSQDCLMARHQALQDFAWGQQIRQGY